MIECKDDRFKPSDGCYQPGVTPPPTPKPTPKPTTNPTPVPTPGGRKREDMLQPPQPGQTMSPWRSIRAAMRNMTALSEPQMRARMAVAARQSSGRSRPVIAAHHVVTLKDLYGKFGTSLDKWQRINGTRRVVDFATTKFAGLVASWQQTTFSAVVHEVLVAPAKRAASASGAMMGGGPTWLVPLSAAVRMRYAARLDATLRRWFPVQFPVAARTIAGEDDQITSIFQPFDCSVNTAQLLCMDCSIADRFINATGLALNRALDYYGTNDTSSSSSSDLTYRLTDNVARFNRGIGNTITSPVGTDTFLTVNKTTPWIGRRLDTIQWPWLWNFTKLANVLDPAGDVFPDGSIPPETPYTGTLVGIQEQNAELASRNDTDLVWISIFSDALAVSGLGNASVELTEKAAYFWTGLSADGGSAVARFIGAYVLCDYDNTLYAVNGRGTGLFDGLVIAGLAVLAAAFVVSLVLPACGATIGSCMAVFIGALLFFPLALAIGSKEARFATCPPSGPSTLVPGIPVSLGQDAYELASETLPQCAPIPVSLVDASDVHAADLCAKCGVPPPRFLSCAEAAGFIDGFDNIFYTLEQLRPGTNAAIAASPGLKAICPSWRRSRPRTRPRPLPRAVAPKPWPPATKSRFSTCWQHRPGRRAFECSRLGNRHCRVPGLAAVRPRAGHHFGGPRNGRANRLRRDGGGKGRARQGANQEK